jgi:hypothetical protein
MTDKQQILLELLKDAWVYVNLDPRREGVLLPDFLRQEPRVVLQYGYNMPVPIADLTIDEEGIKATLSFRRQPYSTLVPWSAIFALSDGEERHFVWEADVPPDLERAGPRPQATGPAAVPAAATPAPQAKPEPAPGPGPGQKPGKRPRPSHLKLVD